MNLSIVIPVFNEEKNIEQIISKVLIQKSVKEIIAVDDGSKDNSLEILKKLARKNRKIKIYSHKKNQGKGSAIITALNHVNLDFILIQDADLEYNPDEYQNLIKKSTEKNVIYGSRLKTNNKHAYNRTYFGNILLTSIVNLLYGIKLTDSYTCYKLIPTKIMKKLNLKSQGFEIEAEITAKLANLNVPIIEVPITYMPRRYEEGKKIKAIDAIKGILVLCKEKFL